MLDQLVTWLIENWDSITVGILLVIILYGGSRKDPWWVFGREFKDLTKDRDEWKDLALAGTGIAQSAVGTAEKAVER